jgi:hypothetical protein
VTWVLWRQHRTQAAILASILVALAILLGVTGTAMAHDYAALRRCSDCSGFAILRDNQLARVVVNLTVAVPLVLGVFLGAAVFARELEQATHVLAWAQSVTRRRWLVTKLVTILLLTVVLAGAMSALVTWWSATPNSMEDLRFQGLQFDIQNLSPVAYSLFAVALGFAAAAVLRRVLPAVAVTIGGFFVVRLLVELALRPRYRAAHHAASALTGQAGPVRASVTPSGSWIFSSDLVDASGRVVRGPVRMPANCVAALDRTTADKCISRLGYHFVSTFQPDSRYWLFQWTEAAIFVSLAAILVVVGVLALLHRDA